jgi:hypothetical protein
MVATKIATMRQGKRTDLSSIGLRSSQDAAAKLLNIGVTSLKRAKAVRATGTQELIAAVEQGHLAVSVAAAATEPDDAFCPGAACAATWPGQRTGDSAAVSAGRSARRWPQPVCIS